MTEQQVSTRNQTKVKLIINTRKTIIKDDWKYQISEKALYENGWMIFRMT